MKAVNPGIQYFLNNLQDASKGQQIVFANKQLVPVDEQNPDNNQTKEVIVADGCTAEEVLMAVIHKIDHDNAKQRTKELSCAITRLEEGLHWLWAEKARQSNKLLNNGK